MSFVHIRNCLVSRMPTAQGTRYFVQRAERLCCRPQESTHGHAGEKIKKLGVDPSLLISDSFTVNQLMVMNKLLESLGYVQKIPPEYQEEFCSLCVRIVQILSLSVDNA